MTLTIGICTSIFASVTVVRLLIYYWLNAQQARAPHRAAGLTGHQPCGSPNPMRFIPNFKGFDFFPHDLRLPFMRYKGLCSRRCRSSPWCCRSLIIGVRGFNYGVDFKGGSMIEVQSKSGPADIAALREKLGKLGLGAVQIQSFGAPSDVLIRVEEQPGGEAAQQAALKKVTDALADQYTQRRIEVVGPAVSSELRLTGIIAVVVGLLAIVRLRLVPVRMAVRGRRDRGADARRAADGRHLLACSSSSSTCRSSPRCSPSSATRSTTRWWCPTASARTCASTSAWTSTSCSTCRSTRRCRAPSSPACTAIVVLISLYIFGGEVIRNFNLAMLLGVVIGTYSSIFIAAPLLGYLGVKREWVGAAVKPAAGSAARKARRENMAFK